MSNTFSLVNKLVAYTSIASGVVKGKIVDQGIDRFGGFYEVKVTTGEVPAYKKGSTFFVRAENLGTFLNLR